MEKDIEEIAQLKMPDLNAVDLESAKSMIRGAARSMGVMVEGETGEVASAEEIEASRVSAVEEAAPAVAEGAEGAPEGEGADGASAEGEE